MNIIETVIITLVAILGFCLAGGRYSGAAEDCDKMGKFQHDGKVYTCKRV